MLTGEQLFVLDALRASLLGVSPPKVGVALDVTAISRAIRSNGILPTVYPSLGESPRVQLMLQGEYYAYISQSVNQNHLGKQVRETLGEAGLQCVPLKGWEMRNLYPNPNMRQMTDIDLLVRPYRYDVIDSAMHLLGFFPEGKESTEKHDVYCKGAVTVEVHKRLTDDSAAIRDWESSMWNRVASEPNNHWRMSIEDLYVHHFVHMHHDFGNGWFGLRRIVDAWLLNQRWELLDNDYVKRVLESMGITLFHEKMVWLGHVCMGEEPLTDDAELLLKHAFSCGIYGNGKSYKAGRIATLTNGGVAMGKLRSKLAAIFLPYGRMKAHFPALECWPVLLPVCWVKRIVSFLRSGKLKQYEAMLDYSDITGEDIAYTRKVLEAGGY